VAPNPANGSSPVALGVTIDDTAMGGSPVGAAEWFADTAGAPGTGHPLNGSYGSSKVTVSGLISPADLKALGDGQHTILVHGRDGAGNWGPASSSPLLLVLMPPDGIFADGFETGSTSRWSVQTGAQRLSVSATAAMAGRFGLSVSIARGVRAFVTDRTPAAATSYNARFGIDAAGLSTASHPVDIFVGIDARNSPIFTLQYRRAAGHAAQVRLGALRWGAFAWTSWATLPAGRHTIEVAWRASRSATLRFWIDGVAKPGRTRLDTHAYRLEAVRLGPSAGLSSSIAGTLRFDRFVSSRGQTTIGR
jgi:hypothetical protein